ncbi:hypothetical protein ACQP2X_08740 [Actinoplanes sp. CA-131856]
MASNQFSASPAGSERSAAEIRRAQDAARAADAKRQKAAVAAGPGRRSIGG